MSTSKIRKVFEKREGGLLSLRREKEQIIALDDIDLNVKNGELFGLLGPNGAGKTTLVKILSTIIVPDSGTAFVNGYDIDKRPKDVRQSIGVVSSGERSLYWKLSAIENLEYFARLYKVPETISRKRIKELLNLMGLEDRANDLVEKYSSGMKQKLALARALIHDLPILLLDEPTLGLDPGFSKSIRSFIKEDFNKKQSKTILLTTYYMEEADQLCDRIAFIDKGKIISIGSLDELKAKVKKLEVLKVIAINVNENFANALKNLPFIESFNLSYDDSTIEKATIRFYMKDIESNIQGIVDAFVKNKSRILSISAEMPTLEDVFIQFTGEGLGS
ncbi:MAG: ATP-binding cassette domain-containing protein [Thermoproteota archaeon]